MSAAKKPKPMDLAKARVFLKRHVAEQPAPPRDGSEPLAEALWLVARSLGSKTKSGKGRRAKGHSYEREVAQYLRPIYPEAKRGYQARGGGKDAPDVDGTPMYIECKRHRSVSGVLATAYRAKEESDGRPAVVVVKEDGRPELAVVPLEMLLGLLHAIDGCNMPSIVKRGAEMIDAQSAAARMRLGTGFNDEEEQE